VTLVGAAYFGVAKVGLSFSAGHAIVSAVWPPSGVALASVVIFGARVWPGILLGALVANATGDSALGTAAGIATGNAMACVLGGHLLARAGFEPALRRVRDVVALALLGSAASTALNATIGVSTLLISGVDPFAHVWAVWRVWWLGDLTGVLLAAPPLLILASGLRRPPQHRAWIAEASVLTGALAAVTLIVLRQNVTLAYPVFPLIVLAAMRFRQPGAVVASFLVSTIAVVLTANGEGPFTGGAPDIDLLRAQLFVALAAMTGLLVAAMRTEWERAEEALERLGKSERALAEAQRVAHLGSWEWDVAADRVTWSDELYRIFGVEREAFDGTYESYLARIHPDDRELVEREIAAGLDGARSFRFEHRVVRADGEVRTVAGQGHVIADPVGRPAQMLGTAQDVTERRLAERKLEHQALHDPLTGLPNRLLFVDRLEHALTRARRPGSSLAVYFCDVDDFKNINDGLGHETGDELLMALPPRLREALRASDTVARFGGDEFVILCEDLGSEAEAEQIAERITAAFALPFGVAGREHHLSVSVGVVFVRGGQASAPEVLRDADAAMYRAKGGGKGRFEVFDARMRASLVERLQIEEDLRRALERDELRLHYQPVVSLPDGAIVGAEALVRWEHPERGLLAPAAFIAVAEESGLIVPLGTWVLGEACRQAAAWRRTVSVNLSARQISHSDVAELLERTLRETGLDPALVELELTESVLMEQAAMRTLVRLRELGVRLVLDDFGTGYSSLSYLKRFPIDALKIDREFIDGLGAEPEATAIVSAVLSMAQALELDVVAEGVETEAQLAWLRERGCGFAQGYLLGRPVPAAELAL
jgi:diguanylate cyclase (GGDEF)-like protein/PAS domain S-box-containing protein